MTFSLAKYTLRNPNRLCDIVYLGILPTLEVLIPLLS